MLGLNGETGQPVLNPVDHLGARKDPVNAKVLGVPDPKWKLGDVIRKSNVQLNGLKTRAAINTQIGQTGHIVKETVGMDLEIDGEDVMPDGINVNLKGRQRK